jgi:hypothetical protein
MAARRSSTSSASVCAARSSATAVAAADAAAAEAAWRPRLCPVRNPPVWGCSSPTQKRPHKSAIHYRFTVGNAKDA